MIKAIMSDLGGVFLNRGIWLFWDYLNYNFLIPTETARLAFLKNYKQYFSGYITEEEFWKNLLSEINLKKDWRTLRTKLLGLFELDKGTVDIYTRLKNSGYTMILLSDQSKEWWPILDKKFKISSYFDTVLVSSHVGLHKPNPDFYVYALNQANVKAVETLFIDDIDYNLTPAKDLGMDTILFVDSKQLLEELKRKNLS